MCRRWFDNLTPTCKYLYDFLGYNGYTVRNVVDFRMQLYYLEVDVIHSKFDSVDSDASWLYSVFDEITKYDRSVANEMRYNDYLRIKKLKLIKNHCI